MTTKIDITSTAVEKGIDLIKGFVEKIVGSSFEETGLLLADNVKLLRFKNQIKILNKAQKIVEQNDISIKQISLKALVPLLEYSSLESDVTLQDKWANLLVNFIDINEKYESTIFPFILNQLSTKEINEIVRIYENTSVDSRTIKISGVDKSNLIRLGLIEEYSLSSVLFIRKKNELRPIKYQLTELGKEFIKCCSSKKDLK